MAVARVNKSQFVSKMCTVCGVDNEAGLSGRFFETDAGEVVGIFQPQNHHQGYPGRLHGGIASTVLDETIGRAVNINDPSAWGVTVELKLRYLKPVPLDGEVMVVARLTKDSSRLFEGEGAIRLADGTDAVVAWGKYLKLPIDKIADGDFNEQWFADPRPLPETLDIPGAVVEEG